jgi:ABC-type Fe3+-hydroxamate transport system substrate-binding protein
VRALVRSALLGGALLGLASLGAAAAGTRQITDAAGRVVTLPALVTRVADPWHANNALVVMLGGGDKLVATTALAQRQPWLERLYPRIDQVPAAFGDDWIEVAGGANAADVVGLGRPVTMEQVAAWNPDVIIVGSAPNGRNRQAILDDPRWRDIKAVEDGKVFVNPSGAYLWDRHSAEAALQVLWAAKTLHPDRFADLDIEKETKAFYAKYFHHALTDSEFRSIIDATAP